MRMIPALGGFFLCAALLAAAEPPPAPPDEQSEKPFDSKTRGAVSVRGDTDDWFVVFRDSKRVSPATPPKLNERLELEPGTYEVSVNKTKRTIKLEAGKEVVLQTGTLLVEGGGDWWAPFEGKERRVADAPPKMGVAIAIFPGVYSVHVRVGDKTAVVAEAARVEAGKKTSLKH